MPSFMEAMKNAFKGKSPQRGADFQPLEGVEQFSEENAPITRAQHFARLKDEAVLLYDLKKELTNLMPRHDDNRLRKKATLANEAKITSAVTRSYKSSRATGASLQYALKRQFETKLLSKDQIVALRETYQEARTATQGTVNELTMAKVMDGHCRTRRMTMAVTEFTSNKKLAELETQTAAYLEASPAQSLDAMTRQEYRKKVLGFDSELDDPMKAWKNVNEEAKHSSATSGPSNQAAASVSGHASSLRQRSDITNAVSREEESLTTSSGIVIRSKNPYLKAIEASREKLATASSPDQTEASSSKLTATSQEAQRAALKLR